jgi:transposase-like protein
MEYVTPEVSERPVRRQFTAEYKLQVLRELDGCKELGDVGRVLRREGLYSSLVSCWRQVRDRGSVAELAPKKRGRKVEATNPLAAKYILLEREHRKLEKKLQRAELLLDIQKKIADLLGISLEKPESDEVL